MRPPSQRSLRVSEIIRHALSGILLREDFDDDALHGVSITIAEVRMSPDLKRARCYCSPLGGLEGGIAGALNKQAAFLRGRLGREVSLKHTPELLFLDDVTVKHVERIHTLLSQPPTGRDRR